MPNINFNNITRVKELPRASESYNYKSEHLKFLKMQLDFIYKKIKQCNNVFKYDAELDVIYQVYRRLKQDCIIEK